MNYQFDDPGYRIWKRSGNSWEEKSPSGRIKRFRTSGRDTVEGRSGSVLQPMDGSEFEVFISDKKVVEPRVYSRVPKGKWSYLGRMEDFE